MSDHENVLMWLSIRDQFFGDNRTPRNFEVAVERAANCAHADAVWLSGKCAGKEVRTLEDAIALFDKDNDKRSLFFLWFLNRTSDLTMLRQSALLGYAPAQAMMAARSQGEEALDWALLAIEQGGSNAITFTRTDISFVEGERDGFLWGAYIVSSKNRKDSLGAELAVTW
jgi:hypothetical protein